MTSLFDYALGSPKKTTPLILMDAKQLKKKASAWSKASDFTADSGQICIIPDQQHKIKEIWVGIENHTKWLLAPLPHQLPKGDYHLETTLTLPKIQDLLTGWILGCYNFTELKEKPTALPKVKLKLPKGINTIQLKALTDSICQIRDMINLPADRLTPLALAKRAEKIAHHYGATCDVIKDPKKVEENYPLVHAVGKSSANKPCFIKLTWGKKTHPKLALVGKGVTFDTGGLNLKPGGAMGLMKKDMGGAAHALGLANAIMALNLPVNLAVYVPAAENSVSSTAMRPGDVITSRKGLTIEIDNTDAEGRLLLADALTQACEEKADYIIDFATLTGAARVALGPDLPALMSNSQKLANQLLKISAQQNEPFWQLPLHADYKKYLNSSIADMANSGATPFAGAITAGLFLQEFVTPKTPWIHIDVYGWNPTTQPGRPQGGEAFCISSLITFIEKLTKS